MKERRGVLALRPAAGSAWEVLVEIGGTVEVLGPFTDAADVQRAMLAGAALLGIEARAPHANTP